MYLQVKDMKKSYGEGGSYIQVLKGISTGVEKGEMCVIEGTSGSGKSTFLNCIGGLDVLDSGSIMVDGNFYVIALGAAVCIPLAKKCMDLMYPLMVSNVNCGMNLHYPWQMYAIVYIAILVLYFVMNGLLTLKLKKVNLAEVLKSRE